MKQCNKCKQQLELTAYSKNKICKDGLQRTCKQCQKLHIKEYNKIWYKNNKERKYDMLEKYWNSIKPGIYMIKNQITGKRYIGQSEQPYRRRIEHISLFTSSNSKSFRPQIQTDIKQYGSNSFIFGIIEHCLPEQLLEREQYYINQLQPEYNC